MHFKIIGGGGGQNLFLHLCYKSNLFTGAKNVLLWKFLLEELSKPNGNNVQWVDEREGLFRFVDTTEVSKLWGQKKNKDDMNFEKLSRGIR